MKDASSSKHTRSGARHHRGWKERSRRLLLGPAALLIMLGDALRRRLVWFFRRDRDVAARRRGSVLRDTSVVHVTHASRERSMRSLGARLALVGTRDVRRRGPATKLVAAVPTEGAVELYDALIGNLRLCLTPAAVGAVVDDLNAKGQIGEWQLAAALNRLVELDAREAQVKQALAYGGLAVCRETNAERRVIALRFDPISGRLEWRHRAVRSLEFSLVGPGRISGRLRETRQLSFSVHLDGAGAIVGWDMPPMLP